MYSFHPDTSGLDRHATSLFPFLESISWTSRGCPSGTFKPSSCPVLPVLSASVCCVERWLSVPTFSPVLSSACCPLHEVLLDQVTHWLLLWKKREEASGTSTHSSLRLTSLFSSLGATAASSYLCVLQACVRNNPPGFQAPGAHPSSSSLVFISLGLRHPLPHLLEVVRKKWLHPITLYRGAFSTSLSTSSPPRSPPSYLLMPGDEADITKPAFYHFFWTSLLL